MRERTRPSVARSNKWMLRGRSSGIQRREDCEDLREQVHCPLTVPGWRDDEAQNNHAVREAGPSPARIFWLTNCATFNAMQPHMTAVL